MYLGNVVPFSNPTGILVFGEDPVQRINLTLTEFNNITLEVRVYNN